MTKGYVRVEIDVQPPKEIMDLIQKHEGKIAGMIEFEAKSSSAFADKTGKLRRGIKAREKNNGWIVEAIAPHAHLVEFGHGGPHPAPAHPFLRPAKEKVISQVK